jgi:hypothetical protein
LNDSEIITAFDIVFVLSFHTPLKAQVLPQYLPHNEKDPSWIEGSVKD